MKPTDSVNRRELTEHVLYRLWHWGYYEPSVDVFIAGDNKVNQRFRARKYIQIFR